VGIGPRKYFDLFSLNLSRGHELVRKANGRKLELNIPQAWPRIPLSPFTYIQREILAIEDLDILPKQLDMFPPEGENS
jgi:hypothetical protein